MPDGHGRKLFTLAAIAILIAFTRWAETIAAPLLLSALIAVTFAPLARIKPVGLGVSLALVVSLGSLAACATMVGMAAAGLAAKLPEYARLMSELPGRLAGWLAQYGIALDASNGGSGWAGEMFERALEPGLTAAADLASLALMVGVLTGFFVVEGSLLPRRIAQMDAIAHEGLRLFARSLRSVQAYMLVKTVVSAITGLAAGFLTWSLDVPHPVLWGLLAFLLNFIPMVGSLIAAVPPTLLALLVLGPGPALLCAAGYIVINTLVGWILEPKLAADAVELSPLAVVVSLIFWGWVLGPIGALASAPMTMAVRELLLHDNEWRWLGELLGARKGRGRARRQPAAPWAPRDSGRRAKPA